ANTTFSSQLRRRKVWLVIGLSKYRHNPHPPKVKKTRMVSSKVCFWNWGGFAATKPSPTRQTKPSADFVESRSLDLQPCETMQMIYLHCLLKKCGTRT